MRYSRFSRIQYALSIELCVRSLLCAYGVELSVAFFSDHFSGFFPAPFRSLGPFSGFFPRPICTAPFVSTSERGCLYLKDWMYEISVQTSAECHYSLYLLSYKSRILVYLSACGGAASTVTIPALKMRHTEMMCNLIRLVCFASYHSLWKPTLTSRGKTKHEYLLRN